MHPALGESIEAFCLRQGVLVSYGNTNTEAVLTLLHTSRLVSSTPSARPHTRLSQPHTIEDDSDQSRASSMEITLGSLRFLAGVKFTARFAACSSTVMISSSLSVVAEVRRKTVPSGSTPKTVPA
eukprot:SAG11_NODE_3934_length_2143_cov_1.548434_4_plen_125_part_00